HGSVAPEHMLLGLLELPQCSAVALMQRLGVDLSTLAADLKRGMHPVQVTATLQLPFSPEAKRVLEHTFEGSGQLAHRKIGTAHLLLGLLRTHGTRAAATLEYCNVTVEAVHAALANPVDISSSETLDTEERRLLL